MRPEAAPVIEERRPDRDRVIRVIRWLLARVEAGDAGVAHDKEHEGNSEEVRRE